MLVPLSYNLRSILVRKSATLLTVLGVGATVAMVAGVVALQQGFASLYAENGRDDVLVFLRPGSLSEGNSLFSRHRAQTLIKSLPEIATNAAGEPLAAMECYFAVRRFKVSGGETNVPVRGVQPKTFELRGEEVRIIEGRNIEAGADEVLVGRRILGRIRGCSLGDVVEINTTPFKVVGVLDCEGPFNTEIWGDFDRMLVALERIGPNRVVARMKAGTDVAALETRLESDKEVPADVMTERAYLSAQTVMLSAILVVLSGFLGVVMGIAAIFTATNTMLSSIAARTHEIGILLATGFRPFAIFVGFLLESLVLGVLGGIAGCLMILPINGIETGTTNFQTFTEVAFSFRVTPQVLVVAVCFSLLLGLLGGAIPAWRAARLRPTEALGRH
jgi:putative ABC transport system permease protein